MGVVSKKVSEGKLLTAEQARDVVARAMPEEDFRDRRVLLIVPDGTRTAPVGTSGALRHSAAHQQLGAAKIVASPSPAPPPGASVLSPPGAAAYSAPAGCAVGLA